MGGFSINCKNNVVKFGMIGVRSVQHGQNGSGKIGDSQVCVSAVFANIQIEKMKRNENVAIQFL